jgi:hypothetical protein
MEITPHIVYNNYKMCYEANIFNNIFGEDNWRVSSLLDQSIIYCQYFNIPLPSCIKLDSLRDVLHIHVKENPVFDTFLEKNSKIDKNKPVIINANFKDKTIVIHAVVSNIKTNYFQTITVSLNNLRVGKIEIIFKELKQRIEHSLKINETKAFHYFTTINTLFREIAVKIKKIMDNKEELKQKLMNEITLLDKITSTNVFISDSERNEIGLIEKELAQERVETAVAATLATLAATSEEPPAETFAETSAETFAETSAEPPAKKSK